MVYQLSFTWHFMAMASSELSWQPGISHDHSHFGNWFYADHPHLQFTLRMVFLSSTPTGNWALRARHKQKLSPLLSKYFLTNFLTFICTTGLPLSFSGHLSSLSCCLCYFWSCVNSSCCKPLSSCCVCSLDGSKIFFIAFLGLLPTSSMQSPQQYQKLCREWERHTKPTFDEDLAHHRRSYHKQQ